ncbi:MAG TPA: putative glycoside hydrolase [Elusimicrobiota bacterium]|nr:putative glycoside hydrolase [Elusimicrobiota bacterium]
MRRRLLSAFILPMLIGAFFPALASAANGNQSAPKLINFFLGYEIKPDDPAKLAKWDIVVLDMDQTYQFPDRLRQIKQINPNVKLLAYVNSSEISEARFRDAAGSPGQIMASQIPEAWFLSRPDGSRIQWWAGNWIMNASDQCPTVNGKQWNDFLGPYIRDTIMSQGIWDGVFLDAAYGSVTPFSGTQVDVNRDGLVDKAADIDSSWRRGMTELITKVRQANPNILIMNNSSSAYASLDNGTLFESFPNGGWASTFADFRSALTKNAAPKISALNTNTGNQEQPNNYRLMRYGLTSALVGDGYYSFDAGDAGHFRTWWYDEYDAPIGAPRSVAKVVSGPASGASVWSREYTRGYVAVNATAKPADISLPGEFERLQGVQDPATNNGAIVTKITVPPQDGVVLLRRSDAVDVKGAAFVNGSFLQVFDATGKKLRNAFFANRDDVPGGASVLVSDFDRDGVDDVAFSQAGQVTVRLSSGGSTSFKPYGAKFKGDIQLAAGQTDRTPPYELVLTPGSGASATVLVTDLKGHVLHSWLAYRKEFTGGASVAIGDLDGDDKREIFTGAGRGGGPHVRGFQTDGVPWGGGFFAFDANSTGGANVAAGDIDGDGRAELVVGSGPGLPPTVRIYGADLRLVNQFSLGSAPSATGVKPTLADIDGDGKAEILIPGQAF